MKISLISRDPKIQFGSYCIRGTRIPVTTIRSMFRGGDSVKSIAGSYGITEEQVRAALEFGRELWFSCMKATLSATIRGVGCTTLREELPPSLPHPESALSVGG